MPTHRPIPITRWFTIPLLLLAVLVAGCKPSPPPEPYEYTPESFEASIYAKAERVFWGFIEARRKYELAGDYSQFPPEMTTYLEGLVLETTQISFEKGKAGGWHGTAPGVITTQPAWGEKYGDSVATIAVCQDGTGVLVLDANGNVVHEGAKFSYYAFFRVAGDGLVKRFHISLRGDTLCD